MLNILVYLYDFNYLNSVSVFFFFFFFNDTATTEIYTLSLHDALPILMEPSTRSQGFSRLRSRIRLVFMGRDRKSTRLNSSHRCISYAVFCLKKKKKKKKRRKRNKNKQNKLTDKK